MSQYCRYCREDVSDEIEEFGEHECSKRGLLSVDNDASFLVSTLIGFGTDSAILGGLLGGSITGGILGDILDGDLLD